jgi:hypothetical protein
MTKVDKLDIETKSPHHVSDIINTLILLDGLYMTTETLAIDIEDRVIRFARIDAAMLEHLGQVALAEAVARIESIHANRPDLLALIDEGLREIGRRVVAGEYTVRGQVTRSFVADNPHKVLMIAARLGGDSPGWSESEWFDVVRRAGQSAIEWLKKLSQ